MGRGRLAIDRGCEWFVPEPATTKDATAKDAGPEPDAARKIAGLLV